MTKRSRTNIQVSENHSHKRVKQYGGANAIPNVRATSETKQIFKGNAIERLNQYLDLDGFDIENGSYKFKFKNTSIDTIPVSYTHLTLPTICSV